VLAQLTRGGRDSRDHVAHPAHGLIVLVHINDDVADCLAAALLNVMKGRCAGRIGKVMRIQATLACWVITLRIAGSRICTWLKRQVHL
jgi:hypothetical protein